MFDRQLINFNFEKRKKESDPLNLENNFMFFGCFQNKGSNRLGLL